VILGLGLNIVVGFAGLLDLGYAAFFAIGAYTTGILSSPQHDIFLNFWLVVWIAAGMAATWGLILGLPVLPLRGDYLAIVTLGFGEIIPVIFRNLIDVTIKEPLSCWVIPAFQKLFGASSTVQCITFAEHLDLTAGEKGINPIGRPILPFIGEFQSNNPIPWYFLIICIILLSVFLIQRLRDSRLAAPGWPSARMNWPLPRWGSTRPDQARRLRPGLPSPVSLEHSMPLISAAFSPACSTSAPRSSSW
jgi:branched-chain amino acid transport system permease protein